MIYVYTESSCSFLKVWPLPQSLCTLPSVLPPTSVGAWSPLTSPWWRVGSSWPAWWTAYLGGASMTSDGGKKKKKFLKSYSFCLLCQRVIYKHVASFFKVEGLDKKIRNQLRLVYFLKSNIISERFMYENIGRASFHASCCVPALSGCCAFNSYEHNTFAW